MADDLKEAGKVGDPRVNIEPDHARYWADWFDPSAEGPKAAKAKADPTPNVHPPVGD